LSRSEYAMMRES